jgi:hypothetical protein
MFSEYCNDASYRCLKGKMSIGFAAEITIECCAKSYDLFNRKIAKENNEMMAKNVVPLDEKGWWLLFEEDEKYVGVCQFENPVQLKRPF